jgi:hypothetical protein
MHRSPPAYVLQKAPAFALLDARSCCAESCQYKKSDRDKSYSRGCRKLDFDERFACILDRRPARTAPTLGTDDRLGFPIDQEAGEIVASLGLIPVGFERGTNQIYSRVGLTVDQIGDRNVTRIDEMLVREEVLLRQLGMNRREGTFIDF